MVNLSALKDEQPGWIVIGGRTEDELAGRVHRRVRECVSAGEFTWDELGYVTAVSMQATRGDLVVTAEQLEKIRRACQVWDVDLRLKNITSHRRFIGPFIVAGKKLVYPVLQAFLKDFMRQQRAFNAATLALIIDLYSKQSSEQQSESADSNR